MADIQTPSAAAISTIDAGSDKPSINGVQPSKAKPEKPDEVLYKQNLAKADKEHADLKAKLDAIKGKIDTAQPAKDSPSAKRQQELRAQLSSIRQQQSGFKSSRGSTQDRISSLDAQLKSRLNEQKAAKARIPYKNVEEIDREISHLEKQVDTGTMRLVDEKKALAEVSSLKRQRKGFAGFEEAEKGISDVKAQIAELKKTLDNPEAKALSQKYEEITKELDSIKVEQDQAYKSLNSYRDERSKIHANLQQAYSAIKELKDTYYKDLRAYKDYENEQYRIRQERKKAENDAYHKEKRRNAAKAKLEEASQSAYLDEIMTAEGLIRYFDPSSFDPDKPLRGPSGFAAEAQRKVENADFKGTRVSKKDEQEENYFLGTGGKKGKKKGGNKRDGASPAPGTPTEGKFNLSMGVIEELSKVGVEPPMNQAGVPIVVEKLKEKRDSWKKDQERKTKENIAAAHKEIDRLETEANNSHPSGSTGAGKQRMNDSTKKDSEKHSGMNGNAEASAETTRDNDAVAGVEKGLQDASIADSAAGENAD